MEVMIQLDPELLKMQQVFQLGRNNTATADWRWCFCKAPKSWLKHLIDEKW